MKFAIFVFGMMIASSWGFELVLVLHKKSIFATDGEKWEEEETAIDEEDDEKEKETRCDAYFDNSANQIEKIDISEEEEEAVEAGEVEVQLEGVNGRKAAEKKKITFVTCKNAIADDTKAGKGQFDEESITMSKEDAEDKTVDDYDKVDSLKLEDKVLTVVLHIEEEEAKDEADRALVVKDKVDTTVDTKAETKPETKAEDKTLLIM